MTQYRLQEVTFEELPAQADMTERRPHLDQLQLPRALRHYAS